MTTPQALSFNTTYIINITTKVQNMRKWHKIRQAPNICFAAYLLFDLSQSLNVRGMQQQLSLVILFGLKQTGGRKNQRQKLASIKH